MARPLCRDLLGASWLAQGKRARILSGGRSIHIFRGAQLRSFPVEGRRALRARSWWEDAGASLIFYVYGGPRGRRKDEVSHLLAGLGDGLLLILKKANGALPTLGIPVPLPLVPF